MFEEAMGINEDILKNEIDNLTKSNQIVNKAREIKDLIENIRWKPLKPTDNCSSVKYSNKQNISSTLILIDLFKNLI